MLDPFSVFFKFIFLIAAALSILISLRYLDIERESHGEYYALILFATMGMMFMAGAVDLLPCTSAWRPWPSPLTCLSDFCASNQRSNEAS